MIRTRGKPKGTMTMRKILHLAIALTLITGPMATFSSSDASAMSNAEIKRILCKYGRAKCV
jgi:hypothetical protein